MSEAISTVRRIGLGSISSWRRSRSWLLGADLYPALAVAALPWSTSLVGVFVALWLITVIAMIEWKAFLASLKQPSSLAALTLVALGVIGMAWAHDTWAARVQGLAPLLKFAVLPLLLYHYSRSSRGHWVFIAFLASCSVLMGLSWIVCVFPNWKITATEAAGVPVRNYIDQTQEFTLCVFALAPVLLNQLRTRQWPLFAAYGILALGFLCNMAFVVSARVMILYGPVLAVFFAARYLSRKYWLPVLFTGVVAAGLAIVISPYLRDRVERTIHDYHLDQKTDIATSNGERLFYWRTAAAAIVEAPILGHGTGSTKEIFETAADGKIGEWANKIRNPHNQTLYVAMQWGLFGVIVLFAFWYVHLMTFFTRQGFVAWIGLIVVVQNIVSSMLNSHLFDFHEGWIYVFGVGVAGGILASSSAKLEQPK